MAFQVWISTAPDPATPHRERLSKGQFFSALATLARDEGQLVARRHDGSWWVSHPPSSLGSGPPFFAASFVGERGLMSMSLTSAHFLSDFGELLSLALELARRTHCRAVEAHTHQVLSADNLATLVTEDGVFWKDLQARCRAARQNLHRRRTAPLELPIGALDEVADFLIWRLHGTTRLPELAGLLEDLPAHLSAHAVGNDGAVLADRARERGVVRLRALDEHTLEVSPFWSELPFARLARETTAALERARARFGGELLLNGTALEAPRYDQVLARTMGLGCEFFEWLTCGVEPAAWAAPA